jgi:CRP-like cAMP-binding protein
MTIVNIEVLRGLTFLKEASTDIIEGLVKAAVDRSFQPGQIVFQEGSTGRELYLIVEGAIEVVKGHGADEMVLARHGPGDFFGEMSFIEDNPRFATIRALEPTLLLEFSEQNLRRLTVNCRRPRPLWLRRRGWSANLSWPGNCSRASSLMSSRTLRSSVSQLTAGLPGRWVAISTTSFR